MQRVLSLLVAYVFLQTQAWALSGGPNYGGSGFVVTGTYAGVLLPELDVATAAVVTNTDPGAVVLDVNALGLFSFAIAQMGVSFGVCAVFNKGEVFTGQMAGVADPEDGTFRGLIEASSLRIISVSTGGGTAVGLVGTDVRAVGRIDAEIKAGEGGSIGQAIQRLEGTSVLNTFSDGNRNADGSPILSSTIVFNVIGFKQSEDTGTPAGIDFGTAANRP